MLQHPGVAQIFAQHFEKLACSRLEYFSHQPLRNQARSTISDRRHFDFVALWNQGDDDVPKRFLDFLGFHHWRAQAEREIAGKVIASDRQHRAVTYRAFLDYDKVGRTGADVGETDTEFTLIGTEHGIGAGKRLKNRVVDMNPGAVHSGDHVLRG